MVSHSEVIDLTTANMMDEEALDAHKYAVAVFMQYA